MQVSYQALYLIPTQYATPSDDEEMDSRDIEMVRSDPLYVPRFVAHNKGNLDNAYKHMVSPSPSPLTLYSLYWHRLTVRSGGNRLVLMVRCCAPSVCVCVLPVCVCSLCVCSQCVCVCAPSVCVCVCSQCVCVCAPSVCVCVCVCVCVLPVCVCSQCVCVPSVCVFPVCVVYHHHNDCGTHPHNDSGVYVCIAILQIFYGRILMRVYGSRAWPGIGDTTMMETMSVSGGVLC